MKPNFWNNYTCKHKVVVIKADSKTKKQWLLSCRASGQQCFFARISIIIHQFSLHYKGTGHVWSLSKTSILTWCIPRALLSLKNFLITFNNSCSTFRLDLVQVGSRMLYYFKAANIMILHHTLPIVMARSRISWLNPNPDLGSSDL